MIKQATIDKVRRVHNRFAESMAQESVEWYKDTPTSVPLFNEGEKNLAPAVTLKGLVGYNVFRTWPITKQSPEGELDNQNLVVYFYLDYLNELGYTNEHNYFVFNPSKDRFVIRGMRYKCEGHTQAAQIGDSPLLIQLSMLRDDQATTEPTIKP